MKYFLNRVVYTLIYQLLIFYSKRGERLDFQELTSFRSKNRDKFLQSQIEYLLHSVHWEDVILPEHFSLDTESKELPFSSSTETGARDVR